MEGNYLSLSRFLLWRDLVVSRPGKDVANESVGAVPGVAIDWNQHFQCPGRELYLELGFGNGEYMLRQSTAYPDINFVGLELHWGSIRRTLRRLEKADVTNVRLLQLDAELAFRYFLPPGCLTQIIALFPCPWPKRDHTHHRLFSAPFQLMMRHTLKPGGTARIVTDHAEFRDFILSEAEVAGMKWQLSVIDARYQTKYERRWTSEGQQEFFQLDYVRDDGVSKLKLGSYLPLQPKLVGRPPTLEELLVFDRSEPKSLEADSGVGVEVGEAPLQLDRRVHFKRHMQDHRTQLHLYLVVVVEEVVNQTFWLECRPQATDGGSASWIAGVAPGTSVVPTRGVQEAIDRIERASRLPQPLTAE